MNCNRLTKSGKPCQNPAFFYTACRLHATEQDKAIFKWGQEQFSIGFEYGRKSGEEHVRSEIEMEKRRAEAKKEEALNFKVRNSSGCQIIQCGKYSYFIPSHFGDVKRGDIVRLPANWLVNHETDAEVTAIGTSYTGDLSAIVGIVKRI